MNLKDLESGQYQLGEIYQLEEIRGAIEEECL